MLTLRFSDHVGFLTGLAFKESAALLAEGCERTVGGPAPNRCRPQVVAPSAFVISVGLEPDAKGEGARDRSKACLELACLNMAQIEMESPGRVTKSQRTRLISVSGDSCDYVETFPSKISIKELRAKVAASKQMKPRRVCFLRSGPEPLKDEEEVTYEVKEVDGRMEFCSTGEPLRLLLQPAVQVIYSGLVKAQLEHSDEYNSYESRGWYDWINVSMEQRDLGPSLNDEVCVSIDEVDLVRYGRLKDPHRRQLETFGNKDAGKLTLSLVPGTLGPRRDGPGRYEIKAPVAVHDRPVLRVPHGQELGSLAKGEEVNVIRLQDGQNHPRFACIDFQGREAWICLYLHDTIYAARTDQEQLCSLRLSRTYSVERGDPWLPWLLIL